MTVVAKDDDPVCHGAAPDGEPRGAGTEHPLAPTRLVATVPPHRGAPATSGSTGSATTVTGAASQTRYGPVQVQLEVSGSTITNVSVLQYPDSDGRDIQINQYALPQLIQQTLDQQDGSVSMVSGATYTSEGYSQSLQSALDQAGL